MGVGKSELGSILSFSASVYGFATGWTSYAADYTVYQPPTTSRTSVFLWTFAGLAFPLLFTEMLGAAVITATLTTPAYAASYKASGIGGLLAAVLLPPLGRFGQFCLVVLALSIIANNCPNIYSVSLSLQVLGRWTQNIPRFVWTVVGTLVYVAIAIPGYAHFETVLENFMLLIVRLWGTPAAYFLSPVHAQLILPPPLSPPVPQLTTQQAYWLAIYQSISLAQHFLFYRSINAYRPEIYNIPSKLPPGLAAIVAFCFGVMGAVLGMSQVWFTGPIGKRAGGRFGGDVGFELAFAFGGTSYVVLRWLELRYFGR